MEPIIIREKITREELKKLVEENYGTMIKADADIERDIIALGGEWHSEGEHLLVLNGSKRESVWGFNLYPWKAPEERIVYVSLINLKPTINHKNMEVKDPKVREQIRALVEKFLLADNETL